jgi:antitoxin (DNA-binding transcriptional repressor) of toxin-antitoxin stability system
MQVTVHRAKTTLSKLIEAALAGEDVVICRGDEPVVRLEPLRRGGFRPGGLEGEKLGDGPDFLEPMEEDELRLWEGG